MTASKVLAANARSGGNDDRGTAAGGELQLWEFGLPSSGTSALVVEHRGLAEIIEVEVLSAVGPWHVPGDRESSGGGYMELWSDRGPTVDLTASRRYVKRSLEAGLGP
jgi:hypothetical protein